MLDRAGLLDLAERRMDDDELFAWNDPRELDCHRLAVLASAVVESDESATGDEVAASGRDVEVGPTVERQGAAHAARPSWSVTTMTSVIETMSGRISNAGSPPSWAGAHGLTATMAAVGALPAKQLKSAKLSFSSLVRAWKAR